MSKDNRNSFLTARYGNKKREDVPEDFDANHFETPRPLFNYLNSTFNFIMDLAASPDNALVDEFYSEADSALTKDWPQEGWLFINPPFNPLKPWMKKIQGQVEKGARIVALVNSNTLFTHHYNERPAEQEWRIVGRVNFCARGNPIKGNFSNQCILVFNKELPKSYRTIWLSEINGPFSKAEKS